MNPGDRSLDLIRAQGVASHASEDKRVTFVDQVSIPQRTILVAETHQVPRTIGTCVAARVGQQHESEQAGRLGLVGHQADQHAAEAYRFVRQARACQIAARGCGIALVEDQIDRSKYRLKPVG